MKQKLCKAMQIMLTVTMENLGFVITWGLGLAIILKLAFV